MGERTMGEVQDEVQAIEAMRVSRSERDRLQAPLLATLRAMRDIGLIRAGRVLEVLP
jgi:hypothetical protein